MAFMQLVSYGAQDIYLTDNYTVTHYFNPNTNNDNSNWKIFYKLIPKTLIDKGEEYYLCCITYDYIKDGDKYIQCSKCNKCFDISVKANWFKNNNNCPHCRTKWTNKKIFINKKIKKKNKTITNKKEKKNKIKEYREQKKCDKQNNYMNNKIIKRKNLQSFNRH